MLTRLGITSVTVLSLIGLAKCAIPEAQAEGDQSTSIVDLPLQKRVCRLYLDPVRPLTVNRARLPFDGMTAERYVDIVADLGTDMWATGVTWKGAWFDSEMVPVCKEGNTVENLRQLVKHAHERGIWVQGCQQLSDMENQDLEGRMKDWAIHPLGGGEPSSQWLSFACKEFENWMGRHMGEHVTIAGLDGLWFDGSPFAQRKGWPWPTGDVGPHGAASFQAATGHDPPIKEDWQDPVFRQWVKWRYDTTVNFMNTVTRQAVEAKSHTAVAIVYNMHNVNWHLGLPLRDLSNQTWYPAIHDETSLLGRIGRALSPRAEQWFWAQWNIPSIVHGEGPYFDPDKTVAKSLRALSHATYPSIGGFHTDIELWQDGMKTVFTELAKRRNYVGGESVKYAALLVSQQTRDYRRQHGEFWKNIEGLSEIQNAMNLLTDVIFDEALTSEKLAPYPVLLLPNVSCLSEAQCAAIRRYVTDSGHVVATMETSLYDEWGDKRDNFALADLFGVDYVKQGYGTQILVTQANEIKEQFGRFVSFISPETIIKLRDGSNAQILFSNLGPGNLNGLAVKFQKYDSDNPKVVRNRYGDGSAIYLGVEISHGYLARRLPQLANMTAVMQRLGAEPILSCDATELVETTAYWRGGNRIIVHLVNLTALHAQRMAPLANISLTVNGHSLQSATAVVADKRLDVDNNRVTIPSIGYGEVIVIDLQ